MLQNVFEQISEKVEHKSQAWVISVSIILTMLIAYIDWATGLDIQFYVFYFIPIAIIGLKCSSKITYFFTFICVVLWTSTEVLSGYQIKGWMLELWNNGVRLMTFFAIAGAVVTARKIFDKERKMFEELRSKTAEIKQLQSFLPICSYCKKIRDDNSQWQPIESYISERVETKFSHGICPDCYDKVMKEMNLIK